MSTFAVFGMTLDVAVAEARKTVKTTRPDPKRPGLKIELSVDEWLLKVTHKAEQIMGGSGSSNLARSSTLRSMQSTSLSLRVGAANAATCG